MGIIYWVDVSNFVEKIISGGILEVMVSVSLSIRT